ncbi:MULTISPECIES: hypothetical protein [unclassified Pseudomonas]|uniref:hypothetical protein n=1 Tax=unclassified Pseudomonas TaxID=196821 RepID=UPI002AC8CA04|nr:MULTISPECIES: hypothetical protein [unclassified Pseudomonas]MEB0043143.1 hypothetical protein [Pseudomonas sp. MH10]MEB0122603.1 hypothetical protein [Pseudomonas sp. CCI1.2]WPX65004.1 hypothetical protein RHM59_04775 [Pseudomonas sp. MH10]
MSNSEKPINVVEQNIEDDNEDLEGADETSTTDTDEESAADELSRKTAEIERKVADGH